MKTKLLNDSAERTIAVVLDEGDDPLTCLKAVAREHDLTASRFTGIGAFQSVVLGFFDVEKKDYDRLRFDEQLEVLALVGDITKKGDGEVGLHAHVTLGRHDGQAIGGHLLEANVRPTLEVIVTESPAHLHRRTDPKTGLPLISFD
jgi:predicted DNA-binding protein with PD1-like motif